MDYDTIFQGVQTQVMGAISEIAPVAITVFGALLAISIGVKVFKRLAR